MVFWKKEAARDVLNLMREVKVRIAAVQKFAHKQEILLKVIKEIDDSLDEVRASIARRAQEEKSRPWIDPSFDSALESMAGKEIERVNNIESALAVYAGLAEESKSEEELVHSVEGLMEEAQAIIEREQIHERQLAIFVKTSLGIHLRRYSDPVPAGKTKDGVTFTNVLEVARQLGGWGVARLAGAHYEILFPNSHRQIVLSKSADSGAVAKEMVAQLRSSLPEHKIPSQSDVQKWLKRGKAA